MLPPALCFRFPAENGQILPQSLAPHPWILPPIGPTPPAPPNAHYTSLTARPLLYPVVCASRSLRCHFCLILFVLADGAYTQRTAILKNSFVVSRLALPFTRLSRVSPALLVTCTVGRQLALFAFVSIVQFFVSIAMKPFRSLFVFSKYIFRF